MKEYLPCRPGLVLVIYLMDIHLITRPIVPELRAVAVCSLVYAGPDAFG